MRLQQKRPKKRTSKVIELNQTKKKRFSMEKETINKLKR